MTRFIRCDICARECKPGSTFTLTTPDYSLDGDLCEECALRMYNFIGHNPSYPQGSMRI